MSLPVFIWNEFRNLNTEFVLHLDKGVGFKPVLLVVVDGGVLNGHFDVEICFSWVVCFVVDAGTVE